MTSFEQNHPIFSGDADPVCSDHSHESDNGAETEPLDDWGLSFEDRLPKIRELCRQVWPDADHDKTRVEEPQEGGWNRVYPITITENGTTRSYVIRIPAYEHEVKENVLILKYLEGRKHQIPIPALITYDVDHHNPLMYPFIIMERVPGEDLDCIYPSLTQHQKLVVAKKLGIVYQQLQAVTNPVSGFMKLANEEDEDISTEPWIMPLGVKERWPKDDARVENICDELLTPKTFRTEPPELSSKDVLLLAFKRRLFYSRTCDFEWEVKIEEEAIEAINHIASDGLLDDDVICLWHTDLLHRNIMVDVETDPTDPVITGVIDWDDAAFAPRFMACRPPDWLWDPNNVNNDINTKITDSLAGDYRDGGGRETSGCGERTLDEESLEPLQPQSVDALEIKQAFDSSVGKEYCSRAYDPRFIVLRRLLHHSLHAKWSGKILDKFERTLAHWRNTKDIVYPPIGPDVQAQCELNDKKERANAPVSQQR